MSAGCTTCELVARRDAGGVPDWDAILRTDHFDVVHAYGTSHPGWIVLVLRRHIAAVHEMTTAESVELGQLIRSVSLGLEAVVGCEKTYIIQFAEGEGHHHVHFHVVPRYAGMDPEIIGPGIFNTMKGDDEVPEDERNRIALALRDYLKANP